MYMCVCIYVYTHICIYPYMYIPMYIHVFCVYSCIYFTRMCTHTCTQKGQKASLSTDLTESSGVIRLEGLLNLEAMAP